MADCAKVRYASRRAARQAARQMSHITTRWTAYECQDCPPGFWHLTSQTTARKSYYRRLARQGS